MRSLFSRMQGHEFLMRSVVLVLEYHYLASKRANDSLNNVCNSSSANHISTDFAKNLYSPLLSMSFLLLNQILLTTWRWKSWIVITNPERRCYLQERAPQTGHPAPRIPSHQHWSISEGTSFQKILTCDILHFIPFLNTENNHKGSMRWFNWILFFFIRTWLRGIGFAHACHYRIVLQIRKSSLSLVMLKNNSFN